MGYVKDIKIGSNSVNLIEPILYATTGGTDSAITLAISNFELVTGIVVTAKIATANSASATLNVNNTGAKEIRYNNAAIAASKLVANRNYSFVYDGEYWQLIGELDTNTWRGIQDNLTSSTNTTESLSAKQGYILETTKVPISWMPYRSLRNFDSGTLIITDLNGGTINCSIPFLLKIVGNGYSNGFFQIYVQGYVYNLGNNINSYLACDAVSLGKHPPTKIYAFKNEDGKLTFWFERLAYWQGFDVQCWDTSEYTSNTKPINHVISITDSSLPENRFYTTEINMSYILAGKTNAANLTTTTNAIAYYTDTTGTFGTKASANGALYATSANGALQWGTLPIAQGGTGTTSFTANSLIMSGSTTTSALTTRAITDNTSNTAITNSNTNIPTMNTIYYGLVTVNNASQTRATGIYAPTSAGTANQLLVSSGGTSAPTWKATANGAAYATSANGALTFGTLPVAQGGTGQTSIANIQAGKDGDGNTITSKYVTLDTEQTNISGSKRFTKAIQAHRYYSNNNLPAITMDKPGSYYVGIGADGTSSRIKFGPCSDLSGSSWVAQSTFNSNEWYFQGSITITNPLTIPNGGTGATTAAGARTNLEITPANIGALALSSNLAQTVSSAVNFSTSSAVTVIDPYIKPNEGYSTILFSNADKSHFLGTIRCGYTEDNNCMTFREFNTTYSGYEDYKLPNPTHSSDQHTYNILTTKDYYSGTWTAYVYDYETIKFTVSNQTYYKFGNFYVLYVFIDSFPNTTFSTMLQIRNIPCSWICGGTVYAANVEGQFGDKTIQASPVGVYVRPNFTGTINGGVFTAILFGKD